MAQPSMASSLKSPVGRENFGQALEIALVIIRHAVFESSFIWRPLSFESSFSRDAIPGLHPWPGYEHDLTYDSVGLQASCFCASGPHWPGLFPRLTDEADNHASPANPDG